MRLLSRWSYPLERRLGGTVVGRVLHRAFAPIGLWLGVGSHYAKKGFAAVLTGVALITLAALGLNGLGVDPGWMEAIGTTSALLVTALALRVEQKARLDQAARDRSAQAGRVAVYTASYGVDPSSGTALAEVAVVNSSDVPVYEIAVYLEPWDWDRGPARYVVREALPVVPPNKTIGPVVFRGIEPSSESASGVPCSVEFRDASGTWWHRLPDGRLQFGVRFRSPPPL